MSVRLVTRSVWSNPGNQGQRLWKTVQAVKWQIQKRIAPRSSVMSLRNGALFCAYPDCTISSSLIYADWPEYHEFQFIRSRLRSGDAVLDVGANVGHVSLLLTDVVDPSAFFLFEPTPEAFRRLSENWLLNGWPATNLFRVALGAKVGSVRMPDPRRPDVKNSVGAAAPGRASVEVTLCRLDDFRDRWQHLTVGFLKIDVEGFEPDVFAGARAVLAQDQPRLIMFESLGGTVEPAINSVLHKEGYAVFQLDRNGQPDFHTHTAQNLFAVPIPLAGEIQASECARS